MANFIIGQKYYYISDTYAGFKRRLRSGYLIRTTAKFCVLDISKTQPKRKENEKPKRKSKNSVFKTEKECLAVLIRRIETEVIGQYDLGILELSEEYQELIEEYPERFV